MFLLWTSPNTSPGKTYFQTPTVINNCLVKDFGIDKPKIAVLGLNPHAGDEGLIGKEETNR